MPLLLCGKRGVENKLENCNTHLYVVTATQSPTSTTVPFAYQLPYGTFMIEDIMPVFTAHVRYSSDRTLDRTDVSQFSFALQ